MTPPSSFRTSRYNYQLCINIACHQFQGALWPINVFLYYNWSILWEILWHTSGLRVAMTSKISLYVSLFQSSSPEVTLILSENNVTLHFILFFIYFLAQF